MVSKNRTFKWPKDTKCLICNRCDGKYHGKGLCTICRAKLWRKNNKEKIKILTKKSRDKARREVLEHYGNKCQCCGESNYEFLSIDHINNNGNKHRKNHYHSIYIWIRKNKFPNDLQILCHNCNLAKGFYGICPHKQ